MYLHASGLKLYHTQLIRLFWSFVWFYIFYTKLWDSAAVGIKHAPGEGSLCSVTNLGQEAARQTACAWDFCNIIC